MVSSLHRTPRERRGITLIELIATLTIIGVVVALLLPAAQKAREAARRVRCAGNLRQLGLALQAYATSHDRFPPLVTFALLGEDPIRISLLSVQSRLLPYIENENIFNSINASVPSHGLPHLDSENATAARSAIETFLCPSDPYSRLAGYGRTSYRVNAGQCKFCPTELEDRGAFSYRGRSGLQNFRDGLSNTLAISEKAVGSPSTPSPFRDWVQPNFSTAFLTPDAWVEKCSRLTTAQFASAMLDSGHTWLLGHTNFTGFYMLLPPNASIPDCGSFHGANAGLYTARSYHPDGVNAAMADGSVRWFSSQTDRSVWRALGTRSGGDLISSTN